MATSALHSAATGLRALSTQIDVIANNLANVNTAGFRKSRVNFEDLMYQELDRAGSQNSQGDLKPTGTYVGLGAKVANTQMLFDQGSLDSTGQPLDMAIEGGGFFQLKVPANTYGSDIGYTRAGHFTTDADGSIVINNSEGYKLEPPIVLPADTTAVDIRSDGQVYATVPSSVNPTQVGQIQLAQFINPGGLRQVGGTMYIETPASGQPVVANPGDQGLGQIQQRFLEASNVDPVRELVDMIKTQRAFEMNSQSIQAADQMLQVIGNLRRG